MNTIQYPNFRETNTSVQIPQNWIRNRAHLASYRIFWVSTQCLGKDGSQFWQICSMEWWLLINYGWTNTKTIFFQNASIKMFDLYFVPWKTWLLYHHVFSIRVLVLHLLPFPLSHFCQEKIEELRQGSCEFGQPKGKVLEVLIKSTRWTPVTVGLSSWHILVEPSPFILGSTSVFFEVLYFDAFCACVCFCRKRCFLH